MSFEFDKSESSRSHLTRDFVVLGLWALWVSAISALELPKSLSVSGVSFLLLYGAWTWRFERAALFLLLAAAIYGSVSLMPSGLYWLSLFAVYALLRIARYRFLIESLGQFVAAIMITSFGLAIFQAVLLSLAHDEGFWSLSLFGNFVIQALFQGILASFLFGPLKLVQAIR